MQINVIARWGIISQDPIFRLAREMSISHEEDNYSERRNVASKLSIFLPLTEKNLNPVKAMNFQFAHVWLQHYINLF